MNIVSRYIEEYWNTIAAKMKEFEDVSVIDKLYYYSRDLIEDHSSFRTTVSETVKHNGMWVAIGVSRGALRAADSYKPFNIGMGRDTKLGKGARAVDFDLNVQVLTNSANFAELFEIYYICELYKNETLSLKVEFPKPIEYLMVSCEHNEISESGFVGFDEKTAGIYRISYSLRMNGVVLSPYEKVAPYVSSIDVRFPE